MSKITEISETGLSLIKEFESFSANVYPCPSGIPTQGFGTTRNPDTGKLISWTDKPISLETGLRWLKKDCDTIYGPIVDRLCRDDLAQNEYDALVSFTYNTGGYYLDSKGVRRPYNLFQMVNNKVSERVLRSYWEKTAITGNKIKLNGLIRRRKAEATLFFKPI